MFFRDHTPNNEEIRLAFQRMSDQIKEKGGELHFTMKTDKNGWFSACEEFPSIITGGSNPNPSQEEIFKTTIEAIKTAFDVPITKLSEVKQERRINFSLNWKRDFSFA